MTAIRFWVQERWRRHGKLLRFLIVGGLNTLFGLTLYPILMLASDWLHRHYLIALGVSQVVCLCFAFVMYKLTVFRSSGRVAREAGTFLSFYAVSYSLNWIALPLLVEWAHLSPIVAQAGFTIVIVAASYLWHNNVTFSASRGR